MNIIFTLLHVIDNTFDPCLGRDRAPKVGVKQPHKKSPFNEGQNVPDSIVSALSSSPVFFIPTILSLSLFKIQAVKFRPPESADHPFELLLP